MSLDAVIDPLESAIGDPRQGLPEDVFLFLSRVTPLVNVDLLIQDDAGRTLLTWRDDEFFGQGWHIPGAVIRYKQTAAECIADCARRELGVAVSFDAAPVLVLETIGTQRTRGHFISLLYRCRLETAPDEQLRAAGAHPPAPGAWRWHQDPPPDLLKVHAPYARFFRC